MATSTMLITNIQRLLNSLGATLVVDGIFGNATKEAILQFQRENGLLPTGLANESLITDLQNVLNKKSGNEVQSSSSFLDMIKSFYSTNKMSVALLSSVAIIGVGYMIITKKFKQKA